MFICGYNFVGGEFACAMTPNAVDKVNYITLQNGIYDDMYLTKDTETPMDKDYPVEWTFDTILHAKFNGNTDAGNITNVSVRNTSHIILKSRAQGSFIWKTLTTKEIKTKDDFVIDFNDYTVPNSEVMEYALVPIQYGSEGEYIRTKVTMEFISMFLIEHDIVYGTQITDGYCNTTRNIPSANVELLNYRYPVFVRNSLANYDTGECAGTFLPIDPETCNMKFDEEYDLERIKYQREVMDFIADGVPKILKVPDGRIWIVQITPNPTDSADLTYNDRQISFTWVEVGDVNSEADLYYLGFSDVTSEWWNNLST